MKRVGFRLHLESKRRKIMTLAKRTISQAIMVFMSAFGVPVALGQMGTGQGRAMHMPNYDPSTVTTVNGAVEDVQDGMMNSGQMGQVQGMGQMGLHLILKTDKESLSVLVGPSRFVAGKGFRFAKGDQIQVTGSKVKYKNADALIAREVKKGDKTLTLRNEQGGPSLVAGTPAKLNG
jgi:hypothetical protein